VDPTEAGGAHPLCTRRDFCTRKKTRLRASINTSTSWRRSPVAVLWIRIRN
jgi:hypothetical protein